MALAGPMFTNERGAQIRRAVHQLLTIRLAKLNVEAKAKAAVCIALALQAAAIAADAPAPAIPRFVEETDAAGLQSRFEGEGEFLVGGGVATFDCDGDGLPEVYVTAGVNKAKFYRNRSTRGGPIKLQEERSGLELTNAIGAYPLDIDGDGNTDLVVLRVGEVQMFRGLGNCKFQRANELWSVQTSNGWHTAFSATWEKGESGQNWPTLAIGTYVDRTKPEFPWGSCTAGMLLRPSSTGKGFAPPVPLVPGHCALSMLFSDWGRTGVPDLRVSNDREYYKGGQEQLWKVSAGAPPVLYTSAQGWKPLQIWGMGIASHDLDGDGRPQVFLTSMSDNKLQKLEVPSLSAASSASSAQPTYGDVAFKRGVTAHRPYVGGDVHPSTAWHAQFADVNHDGYADLFIVKGNISSMPDFAALDPNNLLLQQTDGRFVEAGQQAGIASVKRGRGGMLADLNGDGLLDMLVVNRWDKAQLWRNVGAGTADKPLPMGRWLQLRLKQAGANRDAVGAWVEVDLGDAMGRRVIRQELTVGGGHASGHLGWMHFGLGTAQTARVRVQWPHGTWGPWQPVAADGFYNVDKERGVSAWKAP
jgi:enediyne biosynthesis protein E4